MRSSSQKRRTVNKSQSYQQFNIQQILTSERSPHKSMIYDKSNPHIYQNSLSKKNRFLIELPKIYPIHKKLLNLKSKQIDLLRLNDRRFQLRGFKYSNQMDQTDDTTIETDELKRSQFSLAKKESTPGFNSIFSELILRLNHIHHFVPIKNIKLKAYVQEGNNSRLIKQLLRKRVQIKLVESKNEADIVWTRFSDYTAIQKFSRYTEKKIDKCSTITNRIDDDYHQGFRRMSQLQPNSVMKTSTKSIQILNFFMHNHLKNHEEISDKKNLFKNIRSYCKSNSLDQSTIIPKTYHIDCSNLKQGEMTLKIEEIFADNKFNENSFFVVKPGEDTNRGEGITVVTGKQSIVSAVEELYKGGKSSLIQQYINPLLYRNRKFDIRCYVLVTSIAGQLHAYWYKEGYLRTCCKEFSYDPSNVYAHLTNDAVQKKHRDYGKFQQANKLSFNDLQVILGQTDRSRDQVIREMKTLAKHSVKAVESKLLGEKNIMGFEIFGYDFLIDKEGKVWLIEVNTNPCMEFAGSLLSRIIWHMVDNSIRIAVDPYLDPEVKKQYHNYFELNKFQCII